MGMSTSASSVSLESLLNAYALLEIDLTAGAAAIGRAHRQMVERCHLERIPAQSPEHARATERKAAIDSAYALIQDAPLQHHPISRGSDSGRTFTDADLEEALRQARTHQQLQRVGTAAVAFAACCLLAFLVTIPMLGRAGVGSVASASIIVAFAVGLFLLRRTRSPVPWQQMEDVLAGVLRVFLRQM
jgi:hypothetical protein